MATHQNLTISLAPSGPTLAYTLHRPAADPSQQQPVKLALVAHPLGRLGGSRHDHVVIGVSDLLVSQGWTVCRYDSRGAGDSGGSASWTCKPEAEDYQAVFEQVLAPLAPAPGADSPLTPVILCGYSAGSLAASLFPTLPSTLDHSAFSFSYLVISYPLSVVPFLTLFHSSTFHGALSTLAQSGAPVLALFGDGDQFTAVDKYRTWAAAQDREDNGWKAVEVQYADHFWRTRDARDSLTGAISDWLAGSQP